MKTQLRILVVEDSPTDRKLVDVHLRKSDLDNSLQFAETLAEATGALGRSAVDVVLLDLNLPDSVGLDTFLSLHAQFPQIPIVILSGQNDHEVSLGALRQGAQDYLPKAEFSSNALARSIRYAVERNEREQLGRQLAAANAELETAARVQRQLFPDSPPDMPGFDIAGACVPAAAAGGDLFDYVPLSGSCWGFVVADVSSHGLGPALIMAATRRVIRTLCKYHPDPGELLTAASKDLCEDTGGMHFVTALLAVIDPDTRTMTFAAGGHDSLLVHADGSHTRLDSSGLPLGICVENEIVTSETIALRTGDIIVLLTDGLAEAMNPSRELFRTDRLLKLIRQHCDRSAQEILQLLLNAVHEHCAPQSHTDDLTAVIVKVLQHKTSLN